MIAPRLILAGARASEAAIEVAGAGLQEISSRQTAAEARDGGRPTLRRTAKPPSSCTTSGTVQRFVQIIIACSANDNAITIQCEKRAECRPGPQYIPPHPTSTWDPQFKRLDRCLVVLRPITYRRMNGLKRRLTSNSLLPGRRGTSGLRRRLCDLEGRDRWAKWWR